MDKILKEKWIAALRSGNYKQGKRALRNGDNNYCCLGVACDIVGEEWEFHEENFRTESRYWLKNYNYCHSYPPRQVIELLGITYTIADKLVTLNDVENKTFTEIADYIEENL